MWRRALQFRWSDDVAVYVNETFPQCTILPPVSMRTKLYASQLIKLQDGSTAPVLWILAEKLYGPWDPTLKVVFWKDRNPLNVSFENVGIADKSTERMKRVSKYNAPAGTPDYFRQRN